ncbi:hypothetical protein H2199_006434 [Coniosporium tulheliwenetii]|nr:hypothetical protein H2199_006434 [Cladosporium sp. JES 115]
MVPSTPSSHAPGISRTPKTPKTGESGHSGASSRSTAPAWKMAQVLQLVYINILDPDTTLPADVNEIADWIVRNPHNDPYSPNPAEILRILRDNNKASKRTPMEQLKPWLAEASGDENKAAGVGSKLKASWESGCVPIPDNASDNFSETLEDFHSIPTPRPDITYSFNPLDEEEEYNLNLPAIKELLDICSGLYFPFFTVERKSILFGGSIASAQVQCACNGAAAVAAMHRLCIQAGLDPFPAETMHFSMAVDDYTVYFHVHWRDKDEQGRVIWEMMDFDSYALRKEEDISRVRFVLYNIKWGRETRLQYIKAALARLDIKALLTRDAAVALGSPASIDILPSEEAVATASMRS